MGMCECPEGKGQAHDCGRLNLDHEKNLAGPRCKEFRVALPFDEIGKGKACPEINKENTVNSRNMIRVAVLGMACLLGTTAVRAQIRSGFRLRPGRLR